MKIEEGGVRMKRICKNEKLPTRGTAGAVGYDLAVVQAAVILAYGKVLVKTGIAMALPPGCYGSIAPRSGLALEKSIDVGAGVIDYEYRGELGVILFNFGNYFFIVNMGKKIAELISKKLKTLVIKEMDSLDETGRGKQGYGSTRISSERSELNQDIKTKTSDSNQNSAAYPEKKK